jgi:hypothetical protein
MLSTLFLLTCAWVMTRTHPVPSKQPSTTFPPPLLKPKRTHDFLLVNEPSPAVELEYRPLWWMREVVWSMYTPSKLVESRCKKVTGTRKVEAETHGKVGLPECIMR